MRNTRADEPKTYRPFNAAWRRGHYIVIVLVALMYVFFLWLPTPVDNPSERLMGYGCMQIFLVFIYMLIRRTRTRLSFYENHLLYYGADVGIFSYRIPWDRTHEILIEAGPGCRAVFHCTGSRNRIRQIKVPLWHFADILEIIDRLKETAEKKGIPLREV